MTLFKNIQLTRVIQTLLVLLLVFALLLVYSSPIYREAHAAVGTPTVLTSGGGTSSPKCGTSSETASITPTGDALLLAWVNTNRIGGSGTHSISDTLTGTGSWTQVTATQGLSRGSLFYAKAGSSPGSGTITFTYGASESRCSWIITEVTGQDTTNPIAESNTATGNSSTLSVTLSGVAAGNLAFGAVGSRGDTDGITEGSGETELIPEATSGGSSEARSQAEYGTDNVVNWSGLNMSDNIGIAVEIAAAAGGGGGGTTGSLVSSTFDTGFADGVKIHSVLWQGSIGDGGVKFQIASSNCSNGATDAATCTTDIGWGGSKTSGDGAFIGWDGTSSTFYDPGAANTGYAIPENQHMNKRYFRYKVQLDKISTSPAVNDIIINWSP